MRYTGRQLQAGCSRSREKLGQPLSTRSGHHQPVEVVRGGVTSMRPNDEFYALGRG